MDAHPQPGGRARGLHPSVKRRAIGQQRSTGHNPMVEGLKDSAVYAVRPAQVVRIDDQILHSVARSLGSACTFVQLLVCATTQIRTIDRFRPQL
jgi:hypothetical protein